MNKKFKVQYLLTELTVHVSFIPVRFKFKSFIHMYINTSTRPLFELSKPEDICEGHQL